jgi:hypothetical protein
MNFKGCRLAAEGASLAALINFFKPALGMGFCLKRRIVRREIIAL